MEQKCETHKTDLCKCYENYCETRDCISENLEPHEDFIEESIASMNNAIENMFKCGLNYRKEMEAKFAKLERLIVEQQNQFTLYVEHSREQACS